MKSRAVIDRGVGETRVAVYVGKRLVEIYLRRWSDKFKPRLGDIFAGRISAIDPSIGGAFIDLGDGPHGLLKFTNAKGAPRLTEGQMIKVEIIREAVAEKGPVVRYVDVSDLSKPAPLVQITIEDFLIRRYGPDIKIEEAPVNHIEDAVETVIALPGGGDIAIEPTRALIAIDVDKGNAQSGLDVAGAAVPVIAQHLRLRGLGGLIAIDFPNIRQPKQRDRLVDSMVNAFEHDPNPVKILPLSRFGVMEMTRAVKTQSLDALYADRTVSGALLALRRLEREATANPGAKLILTVPHHVHKWLDADSIGWKAAMTDKIGARFGFEAGGTLDVKADR
ncbi:MAG: hypothetical protein HKN36_01040 [Hellea sp.]|nr:hypothetical protein [Hellea sp.]